MTEALQSRVDGLKELIKRMKHYTEAAALMQWDLETGAPTKSVEVRSEVIGTIATESFKISVSDEMGKYIDELSQPENFDQLDDIMKASIKRLKKEYDRFKKIPSDKYQEYMVLLAQSQAMWKEAKSKKDFSIFLPNLKKIVEFQRLFVELWGYQGHPYNSLLDTFEPEMTVVKLDKIFSELRDKLVELHKRIVATGYTPDQSIFEQSFNIEKQKELSIRVLNSMGYDFEAGRMDESAHPFTLKLNPGDVRITTKYEETKLMSALYSTIHEGGHALYEQNISKDLTYTPLNEGASMGIHESQSRFWENMLARSLDFWHFFQKELMEVFPEEFKGISIEKIYHSINKVENSLIRIYADELTYGLHIILRYEVEKGLITGDIEVEDLPRIWNEKIQEYLGVTPKDDSEGVLQDVHWSAGLFGYFPSYALGNIYAAQFVEKMESDLENYQVMVRNGEFGQIKNWLIENIHRHGRSLSPEELIKQITGEGINPKYFIDYLEKKYSDIYGFSI
ncbi:carboxypeptidase M32 [Alkaliphilus serpentinus]|uniref:carboxypeptidase M32 n=1 Tax=Alkaliphilus serpentinus TaxID=1482731 RepID=UPI001FAAE39D|nr:carboxypeptidase M32 [Alkaliphilus serpentinus]